MSNTQNAIQNIIKNTTEDLCDFDDKMWVISDAFLDYYGPVASHIASYNAAITEIIPSIIEEKGKNIITIDGLTHTVIINNPYFQLPTHREVNENLVKTTPKICVDRSLTFKADLYCDVTYLGPDNQINSYTKKHIGAIPVMVRSVLDPVTAVMYDKQKVADLQEDIYETGGYFIIKGVSKILVNQVRPSHNNIHIYTGKAITTNNKPKFLKYAETRSGSSISHTTILQVGMDAKTNLISVMLPYIDSHTIPLGVVFRAFGVTSEEDIASYIFEKEWFTDPPSSAHKNAILILIKTLEQSWQIYTQEMALEYINLYAKKNIKKVKKEIPVDDNEMVDGILSLPVIDDIMCARYILENDTLPHIGAGAEFNKEKCIFLGYMARKLLLALVDKLPISDRDHFIGKRIHTSGMLITSQFYKAFRQLCSKIIKSIEHEVKKNNPINVALYITTPHVITNCLVSAVSNNKWNNSITSQGISQMMDDFNIVSKTCFLRKFMIPIANDGGKIELPRMVHGAQWGIACPSETPEGKKVGLVQNCAMGALITVGCDVFPLLELLNMPALKITKIQDIQNPNDFLYNTRVFVNGKPIGYTTHQLHVVDTLRTFRRNGSIHPEISITFDTFDDEIRICTDAGRVCRGLVVLKDGQLSIPREIITGMNKHNKIFQNSRSPSHSNGDLRSPLWLELLKNGHVELIGKEEEEVLNVVIYPSLLESMTPIDRSQYTHCEMTPDMVLGAGVATCPYADRNQAPRNSYQSNMGKQGIGIPGLNHEFHKRGKWHALVYPQKPIVSTRISKKLNFSIQAMGQNAIVAVMPWYGLNQEDSLVLNKTAIDRHFMCSYVYVSHEAVIKHSYAPSTSKYEIFEIPNSNTRKFKGNPSKLVVLGSLCHVPLNAKVDENDIIIGMIAVNNTENTRTDISIMYDHKWPATVHSVQSGYNSDGHLYIRVITRQYRKPVIGDKFCFSPDHQVLTSKGWVDIDKVTLNDKVASLRDGQYLVYEHPTQVMSFPLEKDEQLIHVSTNQVDLCVTENHNMYVRKRNAKEFGLIEAKNLENKHVHYKKDAEWIGEKGKYFILPACVYQKSKHVEVEYLPRKIPVNEWCKFYGIWLAEGWTKEKYSVEIATNKPRVLNALKEILPIMGFEYTIKEKPKISIHDRQMTDYLMKYTGSLNKRMAKWVWKLKPDQCRYLMEGLLLGDGHMNGPTPMYDTSSIQLKDDVMKLALHCGWAANAKIKDFKGTQRQIDGHLSTMNADAWRLTIIKTQLQPAVNKHIKNQQNYVDSKHDEVYCCTMPSGLLYVRNKPCESNKWNEKPVWCGNSGCSGQKGTAGAILPDEEMPFFKNLGICPNVLMNPLAFPSRMTMGMMVEAVVGAELAGTALECPEYNEPFFDDYDNEMTHPKDGDIQTYPKNFDPTKDYESGVTGEAAPFQKSFNLKRVLSSLKKMGFHEFSEETVINNQTGEEQQSLIFRGVVYYQRLKHMSVDKIHARATGSYHTITRQPTEGRKRKGGFRVGHMERDRADVSEPLALREGLAVKIGRTIDNFELVWGWNAKKDLLISSEQINFGNVKHRKCTILTLQDGRTIKASKNHPFYTNNDEYSDIKYLKVDEDRLACTLSPPLVDFDEEIASTKKWLNTNGWTKDMFCSIHDTNITITNYERYRRSLILARLVGYAITDGHASKTTETLIIFSGHELDVETILLDLERLVGKNMTYSGKKGDYKICLPSTLAKLIRTMHIVKGAKVHQDAFFPNFINKHTPLPILREFLGGLFGGDGHTCCLSKHRDKRDLLKSVAISWTRDLEHLPSLQKHMETLQKLLLRFDISSTVQMPKLTTNSKKTFNESLGTYSKNHKEILLNIPITNMIVFSEKIGFRYCEHKAIRLAAGVSYRRFREGVLRQREWICEKVDELIDYRAKKANKETRIEGLSKSVTLATNLLKKHEAILHEESIPTQKMCGRILSGQSNNEIRSETFPTVEDYFNEIGAMSMFLDEDSSSDDETPKVKKVVYGTVGNGVPAFYLKVIDIREKGTIEEMCDITVENTESYVINGVISHNCMLAQGVPEMVQDRLLYQSDVYIAPVCQICGLIAIDDGQRKYCNGCQTSNVVNVQLPYGSKLTTNELSVLNLVPRIITLKEPV